MSICWSFFDEKAALGAGWTARRSVQIRFKVNFCDKARKRDVHGVVLWAEKWTLSQNCDWYNWLILPANLFIYLLLLINLPALYKNTKRTAVAPSYVFALNASYEMEMWIAGSYFNLLMPQLSKTFPGDQTWELWYPWNGNIMLVQKHYASESILNCSIASI